MALVELRAGVVGAGQLVLRDYANPLSPRTVCTGGGHLIDARHQWIGPYGEGSQAETYAVVDLPEMRYQWFQLPERPDHPPWILFVAVSPRLDEVAWLSWEENASRGDLHITTAFGDHVVGAASIGCHNDSLGDYTHSGTQLYVFCAPYYNPPGASLTVVQGEQTVLSMLPPSGGWELGAALGTWPIWSPTSATLFYVLQGDVWQWTPDGGSQRYLTGVDWDHPTISPDGTHLAYAVQGPEGDTDVYLVDLAHEGSPALIGRGRVLPMFLNATQLWYRTDEDERLIYNLTDSSEAPSIIDSVFDVWPATFSNV